jgi:hypothetical protein
MVTPVTRLKPLAGFPARGDEMHRCNDPSDHWLAVLFALLVAAV